MTSLVVRRVINGGRIKLKSVQVGPKKLIGGGILKPERVQVICPACGEQVEAVASDGRVKGYCAIAKRYVDFLIETKRLAKHFSAEYRAKLSAASKKVWQDPEYRAKQIAAQIGKHPTAEHRAKTSAALKRRHNAERGANEDKEIRG